MRITVIKVQKIKSNMGGDENKNEGKNNSIFRQYVIVHSKRQSRFEFLFPF